MTDKHIITDGCEFQSDCIEYKDISYLKIMPICAIHELSIACHDKVNKCKYYKLYKQLKAKEQECEELKKELQAQRAFTAHEQKLISCVAYDESCKTGNDCKQKKYIFKDKIKLKQTLTEIKDICKTNVCKHCHSKLKIDDNYCKNIKDCDCYKILQKISKCEV